MDPCSTYSVCTEHASSNTCLTVFLGTDSGQLSRQKKQPVKICAVVHAWWLLPSLVEEPGGLRWRGAGTDAGWASTRNDVISPTRAAEPMMVAHPSPSLGLWAAEPCSASCSTDTGTGKVTWKRGSQAMSLYFQAFDFLPHHSQVPTPH